MRLPLVIKLSIRTIILLLKIGMVTILNSHGAIKFNTPQSTFPSTGSSFEGSWWIMINRYLVIPFSQYQYHWKEMKTLQNLNLIAPCCSQLDSRVVWTASSNLVAVRTSELLGQSHTRLTLELLMIVIRWHNRGWKRLRKKEKVSGRNSQNCTMHSCA